MYSFMLGSFPGCGLHLNTILLCSQHVLPFLYLTLNLVFVVCSQSPNPTNLACLRAALCREDFQCCSLCRAQLFGESSEHPDSGETRNHLPDPLYTASRTQTHTHTRAPVFLSSANVVLQKFIALST